MSRLLRYPPERVWSMLTDPAQLRRWSRSPRTGHWTASGRPPRVRHRTPTQRSLTCSCAIHPASWHICLATLMARSAGHDVERVVGARALAYGWPGLRDRYDALFGGA